MGKKSDVKSVGARIQRQGTRGYGYLVNKHRERGIHNIYTRAMF